MAAGDRKKNRWLKAALLAGAATCALMPAFSLPAYAQAVDSSTLQPNIPEDSKLLLAANELVYNNDNETVVARGAVQIDYGGYKLVAREVVYDQKTGRLKARGNIEFIEPTGNRIYGDEMDMSDDFANGFINALRIETTDLTKLAATSGERVNDEEMILNHAVYTACTPCATDPTHRGIWEVKAERVVQNGRTKTIRLERARFEMFGKPIAYIPVIEVPDHTVKRKTGFLFPQFSMTQKLGFGVTAPYYIAIAPDMDATLSPTVLTNQGFLMEGEFRKRFHNGQVTLRAAGIRQMNAEDFTDHTSDWEEDGFRGMVASTGHFQINPRWTFGWQVMAQSDNNFSRTYEIKGFAGSTNVNQGYLSGLGRRNSFDLRAFYFDVQDADPEDKAERQQAIAQTLDHEYIVPQPVLGGELSVTTNITNTDRDLPDTYTTVYGVDRFRGLEGGMTRLTSELEWKRQFIVPGGLVLTPLLAARGDVHRLDMRPPVGYAGSFVPDDSATRSMLTAGLEARYPVLVTTDYSTHLFEPMAQIYARPDEDHAGGLPNEDAQSFVFDATNLFERDKFSGFDRIEGGTRANLGLRYTGTFDNGVLLRSIVGQSFHLGGVNSFATSDLVNAGSDSGLETDASDYVGMTGIDLPNGISFTTSARLDKDDLSLRRNDTSLRFNGDSFETEIIYTRIGAQPRYGLADTSSEIQGAAALKFHDYWSVFGSVTYDIGNHIVSRNGVGLSYDDRDTVFSIVYEQTRDKSSSQANDWSIGARLMFRTLGDIQIGETTLTGF
ncbi:LPS-assembly protein LptD [Shinella zoogloeoides]|uniref:LPS-assembly protein LptD n=1 Tax=Shinella zoogloeoides TaxID=352475 RepID=UPI001F561158|nr:LPS-assembly protein LptD [Shinella zoogloeoides]